MTISVPIINRKYDKEKVCQIIGFCAAGALCAVVNYISFIIMYHATHHIAFSNVAAWINGMIINYCLQNELIFPNDSNYSGLKFLVSQIVVNLLLNTWIIVFSTSVLGVDIKIAPVLAMILCAPVSFLANKHLVFKQGH